MILAGCAAGGPTPTSVPGSDAGPIFRDDAAPAPATHDAGRWAGRDAGDVDAGDPRDFEQAVIWAHSDATLFAMDPITKTVTRVGDFHLADGTPITSVTDLAVSQHEEVFVLAGGLGRLNTATAEIELIPFVFPPTEASFYSPNALTFVPEGVLGTREALISVTYDGVLMRYDFDTLVVERIGELSNDFGSDGDLVSIRGAGTFIAAHDPADRGQSYLALLEPRTGAATVVGGIGFHSVYGLGYWGGVLYGFLHDGRLISIDVASGRGTLVSSMTGTNRFWGAGVTTEAPIEAPF